MTTDLRVVEMKASHSTIEMTNRIAEAGGASCHSGALYKSLFDSEPPSSKVVGCSTELCWRKGVSDIT